MARIRSHIKAFAAVLILSGPAYAGCDALQPMVMIHDTYRAMISTPADSQGIAASHMLRLVPMYSASHFVRAYQTLDLKVDGYHLEGVILDGYLLASQTVNGTTTNHALRTEHEQNLKWLTSEISRTGCFRQKAPSGGSSTKKPLALLKPPIENTVSRLSHNNQNPAFDWRVLAGIPAVLAICAAAYIISTSRRARIARTERLPRENVALSVQVTSSKGTENIVVQDLSLGGAKVEWSEPPEEGSAITLELPTGSITGSIVWSNAFYAGIMFDDRLSECDLLQLLNISTSKTHSQIVGTA